MKKTISNRVFNWSMIMIIFLVFLFLTIIVYANNNTNTTSKTNFTFNTIYETNNNIYTNCVTPEFKKGFKAGVKFGILSYMQNPKEDDVRFHIKEAQEWYWLIVVDNGKTLLKMAERNELNITTNKTHNEK